MLPSARDRENFYRVATLGLRALDAQGGRKPVFGAEADAAWSAFKGALREADRLDLLLRNAASSAPSAFAPRVVFPLEGLTDDDPFGPEWPGPDALLATKLLREASAGASKLSPGAVLTEAARLLALAPKPPSAPMPAIAPATRLLACGAGAVLALAELFHGTPGLDLAAQVLLVATAPGERQLFGLAAALLGRPGAVSIATPAGLSDAVRQRFPFVDQAFDQMKRAVGPAWNTLLGQIGDEAAFRRVYPFSPVLVEALVALSHYLQRERTALRVLMELLVDHLSDFQLGQVVPVGDLYDALAAGEEMDGVMRGRFEQAKQLYRAELLPALQEKHRTATKEKCQRLREDHPLALGCSGCRELGCRGDNRLVKTLLLAALVPEVPALKGLTATRLVQLNQGTIRSIVPGGELAGAVARLRELAAQVGKLRVGDQGDPSVEVVLEGVELGPILRNAESANSFGARRRKVLEIVYREMKLVEGRELPADVSHQLDWRGSSRKGSVYYGNLRDMEEGQLTPKEGDDFRVVLGMPFDEPGRTPEDADRRLQAFLDQGRATDTVVWLPSFLSDRLQRDLGELVVMEYLLDGGNLTEHLGHLRIEDQARARGELRSRAEQMRGKVKRALLAAYGLKKDENELDPPALRDRHFVVLREGLEVRALFAADLEQGLSQLVHHFLDQRYPRHPSFREKVTRGKLEKALRLFTGICESEGQRSLLDRADLDALELAEKLDVVSLSDTAATLRPQGFQAVAGRASAEGKREPSVEWLGSALGQDGAAGLSREVSDFLVLAFVEAQDRLLVDSAGQPIAAPVLGKLPPDARLVQVDLPDEVTWQRAIEAAGAYFGVSLAGKARNPRNLTRFCEEVRRGREEALRRRAAELAALLARRSDWFEGEPRRLATAHAVNRLIDGLDQRDRRELVQALAGFDPGPATSREAMGRHMATAAEVARQLEDQALFGTFELLRGHPDLRAADILAGIREALGADELVRGLSAALRELQARALAVLTVARPPLTQPVAPAPLGPQGPAMASGGGEGLAVLDAERARMAKALEEAGPGAKLTFTWTVERVSR